ncbi:TldD/PmbA family protein [Amylibacter sp.]|nr:TldD/PmbA family protein [Amylibacter sp.]MDC1532104.1 TldD/PmbA family protein [Amylibacter sp.]
MKNSLSDSAQQLLDIAKLAGAQSADVLIVDGTSVSIDVREGELEHAESAEGVDIGLRVIQGDRQASVSISDLSKSAMEQMAERCIAMANEAPRDPYCGLATSQEFANDWDVDQLELYDSSPKPSAEYLKEMAVRAEASALSIKGVSKAQGASSALSDMTIHLATSNGFSGGYRRTSHSISCVAISGEGLSMERDWCGESHSHYVSVPSPEEIGYLAGERAVARAGAVRPPTGFFPVLFDERISSSLIGHLVAAINGASIVRGSSWLKNYLGEQILPSNVSLFEDPSRKSMAGSKPFDAEGLLAKPRHVIKNGILEGWTLDLSTARQLEMKSTANASRGVGSAPSPSSGNLQLSEGMETKEDLIAKMGTGLIVTSMIGSTINPNTGDYSRGASGFWVENGQIIGPVNECTIAGNLLDMLKNIVPANDARKNLSRVVPSLLIDGLTIAGK